MNQDYRLSSQRGFSLIELMLTMVFVMLGTLMIRGTMLRAADMYGRYTSTLKTLLWADEQVERSREALLRGELEGKSGTLEVPGRQFNWDQDVSGLGTPGLFRLDLLLDWTESGKPVTFQRSLYVYQKDILPTN